MGSQQDGGSRIDDVESFDHMLPLALWIRRHAGDIVAIGLPGTHERLTLERLMDRLVTLGDALMAFEHTVNGLTRGNRQLEERQRRIALQIVADGLLTWHAAQAFRGLIPDSEDLRDDQGMGLGGQVLASTRVALEDLLHWHSRCLFFPQALEPFFDPGLRVAQRSSKLGVCPIGMVTPTG